MKIEFEDEYAVLGLALVLLFLLLRMFCDV